MFLKIVTLAEGVSAGLFLAVYTPRPISFKLDKNVA